MIGIDTNILLYARLEGNPFNDKAIEFLESIADNPEVVITELVMVEYYLALRNPAIVDPPLSAAAATRECHFFRRHPRWQLVENGEVMEDVWKLAAQRNFARRRIVDARLAKTLLTYGVTDFATANIRDFQGLGFKRIWNPVV